MTIIQTIDNASQFRDQFHSRGRGDQFTYEALGLLFDYLSDCGSDVELDVVAICCEFSEDTPESIADNYSIDVEGLNDGEAKDTVLAFLEDHTSVVGETSSGSFVYVQF
jgi:hypothetical protein